MTEQVVETTEEKAARIKAARQENMRKAREARMANLERLAPESKPPAKPAESVYHVPRYVCSQCGREAPNNAVLSPGQDARIQCMGCPHFAIIKREIVKF